MQFELGPPIDSMIAGRPWSGILIEPKEGQAIVAWGFGFMPNGERPETLAVALGKHCFGKVMRFRLWRRRSARSAEIAFRPAGSRGDKLLLDQPIDVFPLGLGEPIPQFFYLSLQGVRTFEQCLHMVEITFPSGGGLTPFAVGRNISNSPWNWERGWFRVEGQPPQVAKRRRGLAWALYAAPSLPRWDSRSGDRNLAVAEAVTCNGFELNVPALQINQLSGVISLTARLVRVPGPTHVMRTTEISPEGQSRQLPYRFVDTVDVPPPAEPVGSPASIVGSAHEAIARVEYRGWHSRYDLLSVDPADGSLALTLGEERPLDPEEYPAQLPRGHVPIYSIYTTRHGIEPIPLLGWRGGVREKDLGTHIHWLETCRQRLPRTLRKLRQGHGLCIAGYGDSLTSLGGRKPEQVLHPNGLLRDTMGYFERYGSDWKAAVPLFAREPSTRAIHHRLGWNWYLQQAMKARFGGKVTYLNWGLAGTTSDADTRLIDGHAYPNGANPDRLARMMETQPDLVTVAFGMNDIGEPIDTYQNLLEICRAITSMGAEVIIIGLCQQNPGFNSRDHALWRKTYDQVMLAAEDAQVAYVPTWRIFGDGNGGATGLSRWSHSCASMTNHPGARELKAVGQFLAQIIP